MKFLYKFSLLIVLLVITPALASDVDHVLRHDGITRTYFVHTPPSYHPKADKLPLVIVMHGGGGTAGSIISQSNMNAVADRNNFIVVYPEGIGAGPREKFHTWNAGHCCGAAAEKNIDDVGFISMLIESMAKNYNIDAKRVYATGHSNGAQMSYRLACELSDKIAAIAPNASQSVVKDCKQARPVPILHFHGTEDKCALYNGGGARGGCFADYFRSFGIPMKRNTWACEPVPATLAARAKANGCGAKTKAIFTQGNTVCERWQGCPLGAQVVLCTMHGAGHTWAGPGNSDPEMCRHKPDGKLCMKWRQTAGPENREIDASELMWKFFSQYALP